MQNVTKWRHAALQGRKQKGFTLIELMIVVVVVGALMIMVMRAVGGNSDSATAKALQSNAAELAKGAGYLHVSLGNGISNLSSSNPLTVSGKSVLDVLMEGSDAVHDDYKARFNQLGMRALDSNFKKDGSDWRLQNYTVKLYGSSEAPTGLGNAAGNGKVIVTYANVASEVVQVLADSFGVTYPSATQTTGPFRWTAETAGQRTIAFVLTP